MEIEKYNIYGQGIGRFQNRQIRVWGAVPGDILKVKPLKKKRGVAEAEIVEILEPSTDRRQVKGNVHISSAPWLPLKNDKQARYKKDLVMKAFVDIAGLLPTGMLELDQSPRQYNYRNKMDYSFALNDDGQISLAFHKRMRHNQYYTLAQSEIAHERINECSEFIVTEIRKRNFDIKALKYLLIRYSYHEDRCIAALYVTDPAFPKFLLSHPLLKGWKVIYSDSSSPTTVNTRPLLETGEHSLVEQVRDLKLEYNFASFFQINPPSFMHVLRHVLRHVPQTKRLVDLYAGVGTFGLSLVGMFDEVVLAESDPLATRSAKENIKNNNIKNAQVYTGESEKLVLKEFINRKDTLLVDPPRSGLHPKALKQILEIRPKFFIYVSCNPLTQARDFKIIRKYYKVEHWKLFDLYPQTPHCESVIIVKRKLFR